MNPSSTVHCLCVGNLRLFIPRSVFISYFDFLSLKDFNWSGGSNSAASGAIQKDSS